MTACKSWLDSQSDDLIRHLDHEKDGDPLIVSVVEVGAVKWSSSTWTLQTIWQWLMNTVLQCLEQIFSQRIERKCCRFKYIVLNCFRGLRKGQIVTEEHSIHLGHTFINSAKHESLDLSYARETTNLKVRRNVKSTVHPTIVIQHFFIHTVISLQLSALGKV